MGNFQAGFVDEIIKLGNYFGKKNSTATDWKPLRGNTRFKPIAPAPKVKAPVVARYRKGTRPLLTNTQ